MDLSSIILFQLKAKFSSLNRGILGIISDLKERDRLRIKNLEAALSEIERKIFNETGKKVSLSHLINFAPILSDEAYQWERKKILDLTNSKQRELESEIEKFKLDFKK